MRLIMVGSPGAGKGTQAVFIAESFHIPAISTGNILRAAMQAGTPLGQRVKQIVDSGQLVSDDIMIELVKHRLAEPDCATGFLLDGFPRTIAQAEALARITSLEAVVDIDVPAEEVVKRLSGRRVHPGSGRTYHVLYQPPREADKDDVTGEPLIQRQDDAEATIRDRLAVYQKQTNPLRAHYRQSGVPYISVDGTKPVDEIKQTLYSQLSQLRKQSHASH